MLGGEVRIFFDTIEGDAIDGNPQFGVFLGFITESTALLGSPGSVSFGVEPQDRAFAEQIGTGNSIAQVVLKSELGKCCSWFFHGVGYTASSGNQ